MLPPDARFCHKCGKPQYEEDVQRFAALDAEAAPKPAVTAAPVLEAPQSVGNLRAVGITMGVAAMALICMMLVVMIAPPAVPLVLCAAGFLAVRFYGMKRTVSALGGTILGVMTGMWLFLIITVFTLSASIMFSTPEGRELLLKSFPPGMASDPKAIQQMTRMLEDPHQLFLAILMPAFFFVFSSAFGGLLAVRLRRPNR